MNDMAGYGWHTWEVIEETPASFHFWPRRQMRGRKEQTECNGTHLQHGQGRHWNEDTALSLLSKALAFLNSKEQLLAQNIIALVWRQVQTIEAAEWHNTYTRTFTTNVPNC